ncbi:Branched-chain amino acid transport system permease protein LivM (TC 3.A.1.4.1) [Polaromonas sp. CG9_12]|uniref:branched-chain amino acid ABC transporter permease n=1 Tax=Polaromonas sp. CG_9.11 TaxID=2787730 RepID=UPI0004DDC700|nr:branched-chain amino acid ABC transporter permease [Polaromonas sp. CG_9.11]MBG6077654.1 branched-chain amino acid transport system permease protein [Polaromonas sp. CG_9.11]CDS52960.1 Branched-chain amino acid transport system permease protein LivM (TC 3.A.1.4.1) [Polaromonas sp. CG9_12]
MRKHTHLLLALAVVLLMPLMMESGSLASEVLIFGLAAMGCNLLLGFTGLLSFGQGIFFGLGSYTIALTLTRWPLPMPLALTLAVVAGALGAAVVGWVAIRQKGTYFVMLTLAFAQMFYFVAYTATSITGGDNGLLDIPRPSLAIFGHVLWPLTSAWQFYGFVAAIFMVAFWLLLKVSRSTFGRTLLAVRDNEERAGAIGYNLKLLKLQAFVISGAVTGLAGALHAMMIGIAPLSNAEYHTSEMILVMTVIGGTGNLFASVLGSAFYLLLGDWLSSLWPRWLLLLGLVLIAISLWMQRGLWGLGEKLCNLVLSKRRSVRSKGEQA